MPPLRRRRVPRPTLSCNSTSRLFGLGVLLATLLSWTLLTSGGIWTVNRAALPLSTPQQQRGSDRAGHNSCVAWRRTDQCTPFGTRISAEDKDCLTWIGQGSGYCECTGRQTVKRTQCGRHARFRCQEACQVLDGSQLSGLLVLPVNITCGLFRDLQAWSGHLRAAVEGTAILYQDATAMALWSDIQSALELLDNDMPKLPEIRTEYQDWVREGLKLPRDDWMVARGQWQRFLLEAPEYPMGVFQGRGIAILAGGPQYLVPAWVNIRMLRAAGCQLPVEMLFPEAEYPPPDVVAALSELGVASRALPRAVGGKVAGTQEGTGHKTLEATLSGFTLKVAAVILSSFREVLFLDSDNVVLSDPHFLFSTPEYKEHGAMLWPDYWASSAAPDVQAILGIDALPLGTTESGQMLFDKARVWEALMLAAYFNLQSSFYYELFSNFMGKGDKESFAFAFAATLTPFHMVQHPVGSLGLMRQYCSPDQTFCWEEFVGNTMTQYSPAGKLLFLHANLSPKWNLQVPGDFKAYTRRWQVMGPGVQHLSRLIDDWERDVEHDVWQSIVEFWCRGFPLEHGKGTPAMGLQGFHQQNEGVNFRQAFRWGLTGPYERFIEVNVGDRLQHMKNTRLKPFAFWCRRAISHVLGRERYYRLW